VLRKPIDGEVDELIIDGLNASNLVGSLQI